MSKKNNVPEKLEELRQSSSEGVSKPSTMESKKESREQQTSCGNYDYDSIRNIGRKTVAERVENSNNNSEDEEFMYEIGRAIGKGVIAAIAEKTEEGITAVRDSLRKKFRSATVGVAERVRTSIQASILPNKITIALLISFTVSSILVCIFKNISNNKER